MRLVPQPAALLLCAALSLGAASPSASPEGNWLTEKKNGIVQVYRCRADADELCGRIVWFRIKPDDPNQEAVDFKNPDPARRHQKLCGMTFMYGFKPADPGSWEGGTVYNADDGNTYHATMTLQPDGRLRLRGYIGIPLFGASEAWTRHTDPVPPCPSRQR